MKRLFLFSLFFLFFIPQSIFGLAEIENKTIIAESNDGDIILSLEFGDYQYSKLNRIIPNLQSGLLVIGDNILEIKDARIKIMGNSFVVHSENILIYAQGIENDLYLVNNYLLGGNQLDPIKLVSVPVKLEESLEIKRNSLAPELIVLIQQDIKTFWNDTYDIEIKVFDKSINPNPQFYQSLGAVEQAEINVILKDGEGRKLTQLSGQTNSKGFWNDDYFVYQNLVSGGTYFVEVDVTYLESNNIQKFETFIISDTRDAKSSN